uniref:SFRICE_018598 n=1 Tax=Spodoptera frugiperda TaxID=7108 RepID=A0A2H1VX37_SPOFR
MKIKILNIINYQPKRYSKLPKETPGASLLTADHAILMFIPIKCGRAMLRHEWAGSTGVIPRPHRKPTVGEPCFRTNGPARLELYHGLTENRRETTRVCHSHSKYESNDTSQVKIHQAV